MFNRKFTLVFRKFTLVFTRFILACVCHLELISELNIYLEFNEKVLDTISLKLNATLCR